MCPRKMGHKRLHSCASSGSFLLLGFPLDHLLHGHCVMTKSDSERGAFTLYVSTDSQVQ